jgi:hypothetical protein
VAGTFVITDRPAPGAAPLGPSAPASGALPVAIVTVFGACDVDGDGAQAVYTATRSNQATLQTPDDVF